MLFDTSSPNRKRAVQVIFASLAILMGGGLVLFGIGSSQSGGGLTDIVNSGQNSLSGQAKKDAESAEKALAENPKDAAAAAKLATARLTVVTEEAYNRETGQVDGAEGQALITSADDAWTKYLALGPEKPNASAAASFAAFYETTGQYDKAARALETNIAARSQSSDPAVSAPSAGLYARLSLYYLVTAEADKAAEARSRALKAAPTEARRTAIAKELDGYAEEVKKQQAEIDKQQADAAGDEAGGTSGTTPKLPTLPTLQ